ncbi:MAG TPA: EVE domain-containing protein [Propionicimonas sp.]|nr:EVE domain-containing protein [Propionicimonas sp.]HRA05756.1 EVE domain-containing protein [Propionicimonas sp.]
MTTSAAQSQTRFWVSTVSLDQVARNVGGGYIQANTEARTRLARLRRGDRIVFYSPRQSHPDGEPLQQFTACGTVVGAEPYEARVADGSRPWRLGVRFAECEAVPVRPMLSALGFVTDPVHWGMLFRRGMFRIGPGDFDRIAAAMQARVLLAG